MVFIENEYHGNCKVKILVKSDIFFSLLMILAKVLQVTSLHRLVFLILLRRISLPALSQRLKMMMNFGA